jgi:hypothetical protein
MSKSTSIKRQAQQRRLGLALRENLKRRKAQAKGRKSIPPPAETAEQNHAKPHDSAGIIEEK